MQMDYMCVSGKWAMRRKAGLTVLCVRVCLHCHWDAVGGLQCSTHKNTLTLKGLNTQSSSLAQSNLFIWWFLICCFSGSFPCTGLLSFPRAAERSMFRTHSWLSNDWVPVAKDEKGHYESNWAWFFSFLDKMEEHESSPSSCIEMITLSSKNKMQARFPNRPALGMRCQSGHLRCRVTNQDKRDHERRYL